MSRSFSQSTVGGVAAKGIDMNTTPYGFVSTFGAVEKTTVGSTYLYKDWKSATIQLDGTEIKNCPINLDLKNSVIEINTDHGIKTLPAHRVNRLIVGFENIDQQVFESVKIYNGTQAGLRGLVEVLVNADNAKLLKHYFSEVKEGSYNAALDMGNNETKYLVKSRFYLFSKESLIALPKSRKKFLAMVSNDSRTAIDNFMDANKISLKDQDDLIALCKHLNEKNISMVSQ